MTDGMSFLLFRSRFALAAKLLVPALVMLFLFAVPLVLVFRVSFWTLDGSTLVPAISLENYTYFLSEPVYQRAIWRSTELALMVTAWCLLLGYPLALILTRFRLRGGTLVVFILVTPLFVSVVIRAFGWLVLFEDQGVINATLKGMGLIERSLPLINNFTSVATAIVNVLLVFMVIPIAAALAGIPRSLEEAAQTLGASPIRAWWHVTLPLSAPGVLAGVVLVFALAISEYVQARILGGGSFLVLPVIVYREVLGVLNWPLGAAMGFVILFISFVLTLLAFSVYRVVLPHVRQAGRV